MADKAFKAHNLRNESAEDLLKKLTTLRQELQQLRVEKVTGGSATKLASIKTVRKKIARVLTVYSAKIKEQRLEELKDAKHVPKSLRPKLTRKLRQQLKGSEIEMPATSHDGKAKKMLVKVTSKQAKKRANYPKRKYALRA